MDGCSAAVATTSVRRRDQSARSTASGRL